MIVCHHYHERKNINVAQRKYCDLMGKIVSVHLENILQRKQIRDHLQFESKLGKIQEKLIQLDVSLPPWEVIQRLFPAISDVFMCDAIYLKSADGIYKFGQIGDSADKIVKWVMESTRNNKYFVSGNSIFWDDIP